MTTLLHPANQQRFADAATRKNCFACQFYEGKYGNGRNALTGFCQIGGTDPERTERFRHDRLNFDINRTVSARCSCPRFVAAVLEGIAA